MEGQVEISVVIPCYNEEENVHAIARAAIDTLEPVSSDIEILFIDNASSDRTVSLIKELCATDPRIKLIVNTRNFGQMRSPTHMIFQASGQAIIGLCADFQDPPALLPEFVRRWRAGADIVLGVRESGTDSMLLTSVREFAYYFVQRFGDYPVIPNATGFGLYDRKVVDAIAKLVEPEPFFRGMLVETGFTIETIPYPRPARARGRSKNSLAARIDFSLSALAGSSKRLLRVPFFFGIGTGLLSLILFAVAIVSCLRGGNGLFWILAAVIQTQVTAVFVFLGTIGDQLRLVSERTRGTPLVFERERVNF